jgi:hypothetical protein
MSFKRGSKVDANFGKGYIVAFIAKGPYTVTGADGPEEKYDVQNANGEGVTQMAYHEPSGNEDTGATFKKL